MVLYILSVLVYWPLMHPVALKEALGSGAKDGERGSTCATCAWADQRKHALESKILPHERIAYWREGG